MQYIKLVWSFYYIIIIKCSHIVTVLSRNLQRNIEPLCVWYMLTVRSSASVQEYLGQFSHSQW